MPPEDAANGPLDPFSALAEGAAQLHEVFAAYVTAGFTAGQALQIIIAMVTASIRPPDTGS